MDRAKGWAVFFGLTLLQAGLAGDRPFEAIGRATLARLGTAGTVRSGPERHRGR
jgi:hypothetical protein